MLCRGLESKRTHSLNHQEPTSKAADGQIKTPKRDRAKHVSVQFNPTLGKESQELKRKYIIIFLLGDQGRPCAKEEQKNPKYTTPSLLQKGQVAIKSPAGKMPKASQGVARTFT